MEGKGLIIRSIDANDRRYIRVDLTEQGKALENSADAAADAVNARVLADFDEAEIRQLKSYLRRLMSE